MALVTDGPACSIVWRTAVVIAHRLPTVPRAGSVFVSEGGDPEVDGRLQRPAGAPNQRHGEPGDEAVNRPRAALHHPPRRWRGKGNSMTAQAPSPRSQRTDDPKLSGAARPQPLLWTPRPWGHRTQAVRMVLVPDRVQRSPDPDVPTTVPEAEPAFVPTGSPTAPRESP